MSVSVGESGDRAGPSHRRPFSCLQTLQLPASGGAMSCLRLVWEGCQAACLHCSGRGPGHQLVPNHGDKSFHLQGPQLPGVTWKQ